MTRKLYGLAVRGKHCEWGFRVWLDPKYLDDWRGDGLQIDEIVNTIPAWWVEWGLPVNLWCWLEDHRLVVSDFPGRSDFSLSRRDYLETALGILLKSRGCLTNGQAEIPEEISAQFDIPLPSARIVHDALEPK